jgi:hypothetical protein
MLNSPGQGERVFGELYEVDDETRRFIDTSYSHGFHVCAPLRVTLVRDDPAHSPPLDAVTDFLAKPPSVLPLPLLSCYESVDAPVQPPSLA